MTCGHRLVTESLAVNMVHDTETSGKRGNQIYKGEEYGYRW
jgi:hypothetical protein